MERIPELRLGEDERRKNHVEGNKKAIPKQVNDGVETKFRNATKTGLENRDRQLLPKT